MKTLAELRAWFLDKPEERVSVFELADQWLQSYEKLGKNFILPNDAAHVRPVVEAFASDPGAYAAWLRGLKARHLQRRSPAANTIGELVRKLTMRAWQQEQRERVRVATDLAVKQNKIKDTAADKARYAKRLIKVWGIERKQLLINGLSQVEKAELGKEFWQTIDERINRGEVPDA